MGCIDCMQMRACAGTAVLGERRADRVPDFGTLCTAAIQAIPATREPSRETGCTGPVLKCKAPGAFSLSEACRAPGNGYSDRSWPR